MLGLMQGAADAARLNIHVAAEDVRLPVSSPRRRPVSHKQELEPVSICAVEVYYSRFCRPKLYPLCQTTTSYGDFLPQV